MTDHSCNIKRWMRKLKKGEKGRRGRKAKEKNRPCCKAQQGHHLKTGMVKKQPYSVHSGVTKPWGTYSNEQNSLETECKTQIHTCYTSGVGVGVSSWCLTCCCLLPRPFPLVPKSELSCSTTASLSLITGILWSPMQVTNS